MFIEASSLSKIYKTGDFEVKALDNISFSLDEGGFYVVFGPSGSGKTTLLNILGGIDRVTSGDVIVDGQNITKLDQNKLTLYRREKIGFVFQFYNLVQSLTVYENVLSCAVLSKNSFSVDEILKNVDMYDCKDKYPYELSGGQQQRVAIARAIAKNPKMILCDEPTGALDFENAKRVLHLLEEVNKKYGTTIILITHNSAIGGMASSIMRLRSGKIVEFRENKERISAQEVVW
ncbi:ABC transporter ATP-binding protein [Caldicellulosiruptoraceae bacterium PP1]